MKLLVNDERKKVDEFLLFIEFRLLIEHLLDSHRLNRKRMDEKYTQKF